MTSVSSFHGLQTSLRGLLAQQRLLDTTSHNIANANTAGYSRQTAVLQASQGLQVTTGSGQLASLGTGVSVTTYTRVRDSFTDVQYRAQNSQLGDAKAQAQALDEAQDAISEPSDTGINAQLSAFWSAWSDLANSPTDSSARQSVVSQGSALGDAFAGARAQIASVQQNTYAQYQDLTRAASGSDPGGAVAQAATQLAKLNDQIRRTSSGGDQPNDLLDQRDQILDTLSGYGQISTTANADGTVSVSFVDTASPGTTYGIVNGATATWAGAPASWSPGGELGGLLAAGDPSSGTLKGYLDTLDTIAGNLKTQVNAAYGGTFFETGSGGAAATLKVTSTIADDPTTLKAGTGGVGSNDLATAVGRLKGATAIDGAYQAFVGKLGAQVKQADGDSSLAQTLTNSLQDRRESVSGVSTDEEMTNLISFQRGYQASARAMTTMDELLDVLINRTGKAGL
jgi:flagellar hook-associated protein 1 FlgK